MVDSGQDEPPQPSERFVAGMALAQTPRQQEIARQIYDRLAAGADVDDVKGLIGKMVRTVAQERHPQQAVDESADHAQEEPSTGPRDKYVMNFEFDDDDQ
jgi:hypothetical protein